MVIKSSYVDVHVKTLKKAMRLARHLGKSGFFGIKDEYLEDVDYSVPHYFSVWRDGDVFLMIVHRDDEPSLKYKQALKLQRDSLNDIMYVEEERNEK